MDPTINSILENNEQVSWQGKINIKTLQIPSLISLGVVLLIASILILIIGFKLPSLIILIFAILIITSIVVNYFSSLAIEYAVTNKRIIIKSGIIGTDFKSIYYNEIKSLSVDVGLWDKIYSVGTVKIDTGKTETESSGGEYNSSTKSYSPQHTSTRIVYDELRSIENPYEIYKKVQSSLSGRLESLYSGRADAEAHPDKYKK